MRRYVDEFYNPDIVSNIFEQSDARAFYYESLITQTRFNKCLEEIKK